MDNLMKEILSTVADGYDRVRPGAGDCVRKRIEEPAKEIHHIDGNPTNNDLDNLEIVPASQELSGAQPGLESEIEARLGSMDLIGSLVNLYHVIEGRDCPRHLALGMTTSAVSTLKSAYDQQTALIQKLYEALNNMPCIQTEQFRRVCTDIGLAQCVRCAALALVERKEP